MNQSFPSVQLMLPLPATAGKFPEFNPDLEKLCGYAAIVVAWHHVIIHRFWLGPHYEPREVSILYFKLLPLLTDHRVLIQEGIVRMSDFVFLPYCLLTVLVFANKQFPLQKFIVPLLLFTPGYILIYLVRNPSTWHDPALVILTTCYLLAVGCYLFSRQFNALGRRCIVALHSGGSISFGLYLVHFPIIALFIRVEAFSGTPVSLCGMHCTCYGV